MRIASEINPPLKWKSFDVNEATWEPKDTMDCEEMICEFEGKEFVEDPLTAPSLELPFSAPDNEYEMQRLQNIARAQKLFKDNLQATSRALKGKKSKPSKPLIQCDYKNCDYKWRLQNAYERHKRLVHKERVKTEKSEVYFECISTCPERFKTYNMTKEHIAQNHTFTCDDCNESFRTVQREKSHLCRSFHCECGAKFKEEEDLTAHECHRCKYCDEPFPNKARLLKHTRAHLNVNTGDYESKILRQEPLNIWNSEY